MQLIGMPLATMSKDLYVNEAANNRTIFKILDLISFRYKSEEVIIQI